MPNLASAEKNLRKSRRRQSESRILKERIQKLIKTKSANTSKGKVQSVIDKASKRGLFHKNKAARLVSKLSRTE